MENFNFSTAIAQPLIDGQAALGCQAGLWLLHHYLDESHNISQSLKTPEGSWWHAIMHRMEGDYGNSKYWYRSVGSHKSMELIREQFSQIDGNPNWDVFQFVDACQQNDPRAHEYAQLEWRLLFDHCFHLAIGQ